MKFGLVVYGSNGDVEPMVSLALELARRGHHIEIFIISIHDRDYKFLNKIELITVHQKKYTADIRHLPGEDLEFWNKDLNSQYVLMDRWFKATLDDVVEYSEQLCRNNDIVISVQHLLETACIAEKYNIPFVSLRALPAHVRSHKIAPYWLSFFDLQGMDYEKQWDLLESYENKSYKRYINRFRKMHGLEPVQNVMRDIINSSWLNLISYSEYLHKKQDDWHPTFHLCGHFKAPTYLTWQTPQALQEFWQNEKPVFMSIYSMLEYENDKKNLQQILIDAAKLLNRKVIIHSSWEYDELLTPNIYKLSGIVSFPEILSKCCLAVHHGGVGISHISTEFNCPSVVIKYGCDHPYNSDALTEAGVCLSSIYRRELNLETLVLMIQDSLDNNNLREATTILSKKIQQENGVQKAADLLEQTFAYSLSESLSESLPAQIHGFEY